MARTYKRDKLGRFAGTGTSKNTALGRKVQGSRAREAANSSSRFDKMRKRPGDTKQTMYERRGAEMAKGAAARSSLARMSARTGGATGAAFRAKPGPSGYANRKAKMLASERLKKKR